MDQDTNQHRNHGRLMRPESHSDTVTVFAAFALKLVIRPKQQCRMVRLKREPPRLSMTRNGTTAQPCYCASQGLCNLWC